MNLAVRLAYNPGPINAYRGIKSPTVRLALTILGGVGSMSADNIEKTLGPKIILAHTPGAQGDNNLCPTVQLGVYGGSADRYPECTEYDLPEKPSLLVSYFYLKQFELNKHRYLYRDWVMDSGAFSAHFSGKEIDLLAYIEKSKELMATDPTLTEIYSLDVIGDWKGSLRNCEQMWEAGVKAIPTYHVGEPESVLIDLASRFDKIALGGAVGLHAKKKLEWARQCFKRIWPKKVHGFGFGGERYILSLPFHSVDATNWEIGPCKFGNWKAYGKMSVRGSNQNLRAEIAWYLDLEKRARYRWSKEMALLNSVTKTDPQLPLPETL
jgi:hypothetical protein